MSDREKPYLDMSEDDDEQSHDSAAETVQFEQPDVESGEDTADSADTYQPEHLDAPPPEDDYPDSDSGSELPPEDIPIATPEDEDDGRMPKSTAMILLGVSVLCALVGWLIYMKAVIPSAIVAILFSSALLAVFRTLHAKRWILHTVLLVASFLIYTVGILGLYPVWYKNLSKYGDDLAVVAEKAGSTVSTGTKEDNQLTSMPARVVEATTQATKNYLGLDVVKRFRLLFQLTFLSATVFLVVLVIVRVSPGLGVNAPGPANQGFLSWFGPGAFRLVNGIGLFSLARILKALIICMVCGVGFRMAGFESAPFIAGVVFCVALISYLSPLIALILGGFAVFSTEKWLISAVYVICVCIVLSLAEKKLYWFLRLFPLLRRYLPERTQGSGAIGQTVGWIARLVPHVLSFAMLFGVIFIGYQIFEVYQMNMTRSAEVKRADELMKQEDYKGAFDIYYDLTYKEYKGHPANLRLCYKMMTCQLKSERYEKAAAFADTLADYDPTTPESIKNPETPDEIKESGTQAISRFRYETAKFLADKAIKEHRPDEAYEIVIKEVHSQDKPELLTRLGQKTLAINDKNLWGLLAAARGAYLNEQYAQAINHARKGLSLKPNMLELLHVEANAYFAQGEYDKCIKICDKLQEYIGFGEEGLSDVLALRRKATDAKESAAAPAPEPEKEQTAPDADGDQGSTDKPLNIELPVEPKK